MVHISAGLVAISVPKIEGLKNIDVQGSLNEKTYILYYLNVGFIFTKYSSLRILLDDWL